MYISKNKLISFIKSSLEKDEESINFFNKLIKYSIHPRDVLFVISIFFISFTAILPEEKNFTANDILKMDIDSAFMIIEKLNKPQTEELITQIRLIAREEYKEIDKFYLLISHLETIRAIEEEEKKLRDLNLVYGIALALFVILIGYNIFSQRKSLQKIEDHFKE